MCPGNGVVFFNRDAFKITQAVLRDWGKDPFVVTRRDLDSSAVRVECVMCRDNMVSGQECNLQSEMHWTQAVSFETVFLCA